MEQFNDYAKLLTDYLLAYAPTMILALVVFFFGLWIINNVSKLFSKAVTQSGLDQDIVPFLSSMVNISLKVLLIFSVAGIIGIETASFVAVLAAASFAIGLALQGSLSNFAAGVMILVFKPYRIGDLVEVDEELGYIYEIQVFNTILNRLDNRQVIVPNSTAISGKITNLSTNGHIRVDLNVTMPYSEDFERVEQIILDALLNTPKVLKDPAPTVGIESFDSHSIVLSLWPFALTDDYWTVYFNAYKNVKKALGDHNVKVAYSEGVEMGRIGS